MIGGDEAASRAPDHRHHHAVRPASGHLVLAHGAAARLRVPSHRTLLPRVLLRRGGSAAGLAGALGLAVAPRRGRAVIPTIIVFAYLAVVIYIGVFAFRRRGTSQNAEEYFLASRDRKSVG